MNQELPDVQAGFRNAEEPEIKLPTPSGSIGASTSASVLPMNIKG